MVSHRHSLAASESCLVCFRRFLACRSPVTACRCKSHPKKPHPGSTAGELCVWSSGLRAVCQGRSVNSQHCIPVVLALCRSTFMGSNEKGRRTDLWKLSKGEFFSAFRQAMTVTMWHWFMQWHEAYVSKLAGCACTSRRFLDQLMWNKRGVAFHGRVSASLLLPSSVACACCGTRPRPLWHVPGQARRGGCDSPAT